MIIILLQLLFATSIYEKTFIVMELVCSPMIFLMDLATLICLGSKLSVFCIMHKLIRAVTESVFLQLQQVESSLFYPMLAKGGMDECIYPHTRTSNSISKGSCDMCYRKDINICHSCFSRYSFLFEFEYVIWLDLLD